MHLLEYFYIYIQIKEVSFEGFQILMPYENFIDEFSSMEFEQRFDLRLVNNRYT